MRVGATIFNQNYNDWDRYEAEERGKSVPKRAVRSDREIFTEELNIARIAKQGVPPLTIPTTSLELALANMRQYAELRHNAGYGPSHTKLALWTYVAETESEAQAEAQQYMGEYADSALWHYELLGTHLQNTKGYQVYGELQNALRKDASPFRQAFYRSHPWGTPDQVIGRTTELATAFGTDEIMFVFKYGSMPMATA